MHKSPCHTCSSALWSSGCPFGFPSSLVSGENRAVLCRGQRSQEAILWMDEILHHLKIPGTMVPLKIPTNNAFLWFQSGAGFRPSTVVLDKHRTEVDTPLHFPRPSFGSKPSKARAEVILIVSSSWLLAQILTPASGHALHFFSLVALPFFFWPLFCVHFLAGQVTR